jgi:membrane protease YdiL (CAAX protease family)
VGRCGLRVALLTAFAPIEEIVWRGYAIKSLTQHLRSTGAAVLIASVAFGLMHWWGGPAHVVIASIVGIAFSGLYLWRRSLVANLVAHFVLDFPLVLFMLFPVAPPS